MSRIKSTFERLAAAQRKALIPFVTAGFPRLDLTVPLMRTLVESGADIIELGVPFSDPMADGPTIQRSSEKALANGMTLHRVLSAVAEFRQRDKETPVVLMGYANPVEAMGQTAFADAAQVAGVDGVLVVDYPPEEAADFAQTLRERGLDPIFLLAPTSLPERYEQVGKLAHGYVYYVSLKGVTGSGGLNVAEIAERIPAIRNAVKIPVGVGFGIRDAATAAKMSAIADAVVVGSRIIEELEQAPVGEELQRVAALMGELRQGVDAGSSSC
ncbi:tryptophan synthase alpha chain [Betaproteobacteria bacterium]|nr:tryptophan synthase alpha chain [Betaproteobacteria bacterium]GHU40637.1 tryptophan synthase alpha chain [Betaproteobacteria bacterium]